MKNNGNVKILSMLLALVILVFPMNYEDSSHSVEIPGNPITTIVKP